MTWRLVLPRGATRVRLALLAALCALAACGPSRPPPRTPAQVRAQLLRLLPPGVHDRQGWATDVEAAFTALRIEGTDENLCAALAVTEQESTFHADPEVPGLGRIAIAEIERRAGAHHVPKFAVRAALQIDSPDGRTYQQRLERVRTERELSTLYEEMIAQVPMGPRLLARANPVHTGGPMQVSIEFAQQFAQAHDYPWPLADGSIRHEVFTRRGGMYFGIAHLLAYRAPYTTPLYRFADYNAGFYASRNAAFQQAVARVAKRPLALDGDLVRYGRGQAPGATETAVLALAPRLDLSEAQIRRALRKGNGHDFEKTALYRRVFEMADAEAGLHVPRAVMPDIALKSPKITRKLTTGWFATRVDKRYRQCLARG
jgi:hypothetical protein